MKLQSQNPPQHLPGLLSSGGQRECAPVKSCDSERRGLNLVKLGKCGAIDRTEEMVSQPREIMLCSGALVSLIPALEVVTFSPEAHDRRIRLPFAAAPPPRQGVEALAAIPSITTLLQPLPRPARRQRRMPKGCCMDMQVVYACGLRATEVRGASKAHWCKA
eukprot:CAMPEP_0174742252 /NCGR_PEP_ID=MMETSP1094-20130205/78370_1 /TAXON_ID=156173 /ORGANISM="Chrysochromulina brevifilum, Strain UTEX LB 985" /LENGTH=161 /DNA_ID=CAMNT_0015946279 /DNA_START=110 /DNA_END=595 /DNA_ORIENTATION=+